MSSIVDPVGFETDDLLTRIIPGSLVVLIITVSAIGLDSITEFSAGWFVVIIISSFMTGEAIDLIRHECYRVPRSFKRMVYRSKPKLSYLYLSDRKFQKYCRSDTDQIGKEFYIEQEYSKDLIAELSGENQLPGDKYLPEHLYYLLLKKSQKTQSPEERRRYTLTKFRTNLRIAVIFIISWGLAGALLMTVGINIISLDGLLLSFMIPIVFFSIVPIAFGTIGQTHVSDIIREYVYQKEAIRD